MLKQVSKVATLAGMLATAATQTSCNSRQPLYSTNTTLLSKKSFGDASFNSHSLAADMRNANAGFRIFDAIPLGEDIVDEQGITITGKILPYWTLRTDEIVPHIIPHQGDRKGEVRWGRPDGLFRIFVKHPSNTILTKVPYTQQLDDLGNGVFDLREPKTNVELVQIGDLAPMPFASGPTSRNQPEVLALVQNPTYQGYTTKDNQGNTISRLSYKGDVFTERFARIPSLSDTGFTRKNLTGARIVSSTPGQDSN